MRLVAIKIYPVKYGRQWRWLNFPSFTDLAFAKMCHLLAGSYDHRACLGVAMVFPRRRGLGLLINPESFLAGKRQVRWL